MRYSAGSPQVPCDCPVVGNGIFPMQLRTDNGDRRACALVAVAFRDPHRDRMAGVTGLHRISRIVRAGYGVAVAEPLIAYSGEIVIDGIDGRDQRLAHGGGTGDDRRVDRADVDGHAGRVRRRRTRQAGRRVGHRRLEAQRVLAVELRRRRVLQPRQCRIHRALQPGEGQRRGSDTRQAAQAGCARPARETQGPVMNRQRHRDGVVSNTMSRATRT